MKHRLKAGEIFCAVSKTVNFGNLNASEASAAVIQAKVEELKKYKEMYDNALMNAALTFIEPFPIGLIITLISAAVLRKRPQTQTAAWAAIAS